MQTLARPCTVTALALLCGPDPAAWSQPGQTAVESPLSLFPCFPAGKCITSQLISANPEILIGSMMPVLFAE